MTRILVSIEDSNEIISKECICYTFGSLKVDNGVRYAILKAVQTTTLYCTDHIITQRADPKLAYTPTNYYNYF